MRVLLVTDWPGEGGGMETYRSLAACGRPATRFACSRAAPAAASRSPTTSPSEPVAHWPRAWDSRAKPCLALGFGESQLAAELDRKPELDVLGD